MLPGHLTPLDHVVELGSLKGKPLWSDHPLPISTNFKTTFDRIGPSIPNILLSIPFMVLAGFVCQLNGKSVSPYGASVLQGATLAATAWPIVFAAIIGSLVRAIALYRAEKGTNLGTLEILLGSQTFLSTLKIPFNSGVMSFWTAALAIIWVNSLLGGQAVLRSIQVTDVVHAQDYSLLYDPAANFGLPLDTIWADADGMSTSFGQISSMIGAALFAPYSLAQASNGSSSSFQAAVEQLGGVKQAVASQRADLWGNIRVPILDSLPGYRSQSPYDWVEVPTDQIITYESLAGIPVRGLPQRVAGNATLQISAAYASLECSPWFNTTKWRRETPGALMYHKATNDSIIQEFVSPLRRGVIATVAEVYMDVPNTGSGWSWNSKDITGSGADQTGSLVFGSIRNSTVCDIYRNQVDLTISCERQQEFGQMDCQVHKMRHSPDYPAVIPDTQLIGSVSNGAGILINYIPWLLPSYHPAQMSPIEGYISDPSTPVTNKINELVGITDQFTRLPRKVFAQRLAIILNTALRLSFDPQSTQNFEFTNLTDAANRVGVASTDTRPRFGNATARFTTRTASYEIQSVWIGLYITALVVMFVCAISTVVLRLGIRAPDFLDTVGALTRDSLYINVPRGGSTLSGNQLTKALKDRRLRIIDVQPESMVGYIALADDDGEKRERLDKDGRVYE